MESQSAVEYLTTYGWAILIIAIALFALFSLGILNPLNSAGQQCSLSSGLSCTIVRTTTNGLVTINLVQTTQSQINITSISCNSNNILANVYAYPPGSQITLRPGTNATLSVQCWSGTNSLSGAIGSTLPEYLFITYNETFTGFPHTASGRIVTKVSAIPTISTTSTTTTSTTSTTTSTTTTSTTTIVYSYAGTSSTASASLTLTAGYPWYFCSGVSGWPLTSISWTSDQTGSGGYSAIGHQTSNVCSFSSTGGPVSLSGVGVNALSYTLRTSGQGSGTSFSFNYIVGDSSQYTFILISAIRPMTSESLPAGCSTVVDQINTYETYVAACYGQSPNTYTYSGTTSSGDYPPVWSVYSFG
jgi:hypothetical protein